MQNLVQFLIAGGILLPFVAVIALMVVVFAWSKKQEEKRTAALHAAAEQMGLAFAPLGDDGVVAHLAGFELFSLGRDRRTFNMLHGQTEDVHVAIFDYQYTTGSGKNRHSPRQTVLCVQSPLLDLPSFALRPEHFFHRIGEWFGFRDIDFDSHPKFSSAWLLRGNEEASIRNLFDAEVLGFFENVSNLCVEAHGSRLICYRGGQRVEPANIRAWLDEGFGVYLLFRSRPQANPPALP